MVGSWWRGNRKPTCQTDQSVECDEIYHRCWWIIDSPTAGSPSPHWHLDDSHSWTPRSEGRWRQPSGHWTSQRTCNTNLRQWMHGPDLMDDSPCFTNFFDQNPLQVGILLSLQFQSPEVPKPQFAVPVLLASWITAEHEVDSVLLVVDQLMCVPGIAS